jgi:hypothetical protein
VQCVNIIEKYGAQLAAKVHEHMQTNALTLWKNAHLLAVQRLLCHDIATVCPSDMYDVGMHMVCALPALSYALPSYLACPCGAERRALVWAGRSCELLHVNSAARERGVERKKEGERGRGREVEA